MKLKFLTDRFIRIHGSCRAGGVRLSLAPLDFIYLFILRGGRRRPHRNKNHQDNNGRNKTLALVSGPLSSASSFENVCQEGVPTSTIFFQRKANTKKKSMRI